MPIYEYACAACRHQFEEWQKMSDPPVKVCPKCKARKVERLISQTSFQLKGGGWYSDLYASSKPGASGKSDGDGKAKPAGASSSNDSSGTDSSSSKDSSRKDSSSKAKPDKKPAKKAEAA